MKWRDIVEAIRLPVQACFAFTLAQRRLLLGVLLLFGLGLAARWWHLRSTRPAPYTPPQEHLQP